MGAAAANVCDVGGHLAFSIRLGDTLKPSTCMGNWLAKRPLNVTFVTKPFAMTCRTNTIFAIRTPFTRNNKMQVLQIVMFVLI